MRIDLLLSKLYLIKTRTVANTACDKELVFINGKKAKASSVTKSGDIITFTLGEFKTTFKLITIPTGNVAKKSASDFYEILDRVKLEAI